MDGRFDDGISRRRLLGNSAASVAGLSWLASLQTFNQRAAHGSTMVASPYGPIAPIADANTGLPLLQLPNRFEYVSYGWTGDLMSDGVRTPALHDGMDVLQGDDDDHDRGRGRGRDDDNDRGRGRGHGDDRGSGRYNIIVRNHEVAAGTPYVNNPQITYRSDGGGGTTNVVFDQRRGKFVRAWSSLAGTIRNCAGGRTPWNTWLTCEETLDAGHGWVFEVGAVRGDPTPLTAMGRFSHEALAVDSDTGFVYETEDSTNCGLFRFVPECPGRLERGGRLFMMRVRDVPNANFGIAYPIGTTWSVDWVRINDPLAQVQSCYEQGAVQGGARFSRLEGCWEGNRHRHRRGQSGNYIYIVSTDGGQAGEGQVFRYDPHVETITLIYDSPGQFECENPDNITVTPRGGLILCEDNAGPTTNDGERLIGLTDDGNAFTFAKNNVVLTTAYNDRVAAGDYRQAEWAGACFSTDGDWLFVNIQTPGITFAITGPWHRGPL